MSYTALKTLADLLEGAGYTVKWPGQAVPDKGPYIALDVVAATANNAYGEECGLEMRVQVAYWQQTRAPKTVLLADQTIAALLTPKYPRLSAAQILQDGTWMAALSDYVIMS